MLQEYSEKEIQKEEELCQLRTRIFAMYPFCDMAKKMLNDKDDWGILEGNDYYMTELCKYCYPFQDAHEKVKLLLTPLNKATDIDILKVCEAQHSLPFKGRNKKFFIVSKRDDNYAEVTNKYNDYSYMVDFTDGQIDVYCKGEPDLLGNSVEAVDKWRELYYALPYKGKSIFDMGIAVDKTTFKLTDWE